MWHGIHGHDHVVERFRQSLAQGRLASSYLFLGPAGVGKHTFALKLTQALLCQNASARPLDPCDNCESCLFAESDNHPDLDLIGLPAGKLRLPVELFVGDRDHRHQQGLCHNIALRPRLGNRRIALIDDADCLTNESANCLLKTLEEPPQGTVLILIGTSRSRQLPTILSRVQTVLFDPLPTEVVSQLLCNLGITSDTTHASRLARRSAGSIRTAIELADPDLQTLEERLMTQLLPTTLDSVPLAADLIALINQAGKEANLRRQRLRVIFRMVSDLFRSVLRASCGVSEDHGHPQAAAIEAWLQLGPVAESTALAVLDRCLEAESQLDRNANQATLLECWLDDLAEIFSPASSIKSRLST